MDVLGNVVREDDSLKVMLKKCKLTRSQRYPKEDPFKVESIIAAISRPTGAGHSKILRASLPHPIDKEFLSGEEIDLAPLELDITLHGLEVEKADWLTFELEHIDPHDNSRSVVILQVYRIMFPEARPVAER
jgi:hypothetical protein